MTYPPEPSTAFGKPLHDRFKRGDASSPLGRSQVKFILLGDPDAVDQSVIELERCGFCDSYAWTQPIIVRASAPPIQPLPGELMRLYQRWYPVTGLRIPL
jgi:hypothetical protein